jgi:hypothetical protein
MTWHVDTATAGRYARSSTDAAVAASVEAHLMACEQCRAMVNAEVDDAPLTAAWQRIEDALDAPRVGWLERTLTALGCSDVTGRIITATTRARWAYLFVVAFNVTLGVLSAEADNADAVFAVFLLVAPLGPLVATASAFGRWFDPCHAILRPLPTSTWRMILIRTVAGVVPAIFLTGVALPWIADRGWLAIAWLLPTLALSLVTLALATWLDVELTAVLVATVWLGIPIALHLPTADLLDLIAGPVQVISIAAGTAGFVTAVARRTRFDYKGL